MSTYLALMTATFKIPNTKAKDLLPIGIFVLSHGVMQAMGFDAAQIKDLMQGRSSCTKTKMRSLIFDRLTLLKSDDAVTYPLPAMSNLSGLQSILNPIDNNDHHFEQQDIASNELQSMQHSGVQSGSSYQGGVGHLRVHHHGYAQHANVRSLFLNRTALPIFEPINPQNIAAAPIDSRLNGPTVILLNLGYNANHNASNHVAEQRYNPLLGYILSSSSIPALPNG